MSLINELRSSIDYYASLTGRSAIRRVVITGGGSRLSGFAELLQQQLRLPVVQGSALGRIDCSRLHLPPEEIARLDPAVAVVVGLALPGSKDVKELDLLPPEVILGRRRKQMERSVVLVGLVIVVVMVGFGALRFLKVHNAENQVASLQGQIGNLSAQIPKYNKVEQERATILDLAAISNPIVQDEVYWPGVFTALTRATPSGGTISSFSANSVGAGNRDHADEHCTGRSGCSSDSVGQHLSPIAVRLPVFPQLVLLDQWVRQTDRQRVHRDLPGCVQADRL